ncbi:MAG: helix-turn-helix domain-containing protein [Methylophilaceae bacterium]
MIQLQISELIKAKKVEWNRKITINEVAETTGISRMTLFRMMKNTSHNTVTDHLDSLCTFFDCELHELVRYVPNNHHQIQQAA